MNKIKCCRKKGFVRRKEKTRGQERKAEPQKDELHEDILLNKLKPLEKIADSDGECVIVKET